MDRIFDGNELSKGKAMPSPNNVRGLIDVE